MYSSAFLLTGASTGIASPRCWRSMLLTRSSSAIRILRLCHLPEAWFSWLGSWWIIWTTSSESKSAETAGDTIIGGPYDLALSCVGMVGLPLSPLVRTTPVFLPQGSPVKVVVTSWNIWHVVYGVITIRSLSGKTDLSRKCARWQMLELEEKMEWE